MKIGTVSLSLVFLFLLPSVIWFFFPNTSTTIGVLFGAIIMFFLTLFLPQIIKSKFKGKNLLLLFLLINVILVFRGFINSKTSQDWKFLLSQIMIVYLSFPMLIFFGRKLDVIRITFNTFFKFGILICTIFLFSNRSLMMNGFPHNVAPIMLFVFFVPYVNLKKKIIILVILFISFISNTGQRANMLNIIVSLLIMSTYYVRRFILLFNIIPFLRKVLLITPILLLVLGVSGKFNVFKINEYIGDVVVSNNGKKDNLVVDSRTGIYLDVILALHKEKAYLMGLGGSGKTETYLSIDPFFARLYKEGRRATESGMLNYAQYSGIFGIVVYFSVFMLASWLAIAKSKNWFMIMIGLWILYRGLFAFIEDRLIINLFTLFLALSIGMCFNPNLREMSDLEIKEFIKKILNVDKTKI